MKKKIYVCGNVLVDADSMPFKILPELKALLPELEFIDFDPTENFPQDDPLYIIDTVINAGAVTVLKDLKGLADAPRFSTHDADLAFHLKWLEKMEKLPEVTIFGVPAEGDVKNIVKEVAGALRRELTPT
jgi:Ni,Fe-hydrogenase maturation factor